MFGPNGKSRIPFVLFVALFLWFCLFSQPGALGLVGPDEPRYAFIARAMAATGDWITPRLFNRPWFEKPILYYWFAGICFRLFHGSEFPARLPSAFAALGSTLAMAWAAARLYGLRVALCVLLVLPTSVAFIGFARSATPDMLFSATLAIALAAASTICLEPKSPETHRAVVSPPRTNPVASLFVFGAALGLATLAKGPAALILAGGSVGLWAALSGHWRAAFRLMRPTAVITFCAVTLPWYFLCAQRNPDFLRVFLLEHNFERYLTPMFLHREPFWFFLPILLLGIFPWTGVLGWLAADGWRVVRSNDWRNSPGFFLGCWVIFPFFFFSFSQSKLPGYILPAVPPLGILLARTLQTAEMKPRRTRAIFAAIGATWLVLAASAPVWWKKIPPGAFGIVHHEVILLVIAAALAGLAVIAVGMAGRLLPALILSSAIVVILVQIVSVSLLPALDPFLSAREAASDAQALNISTSEIAGFRLARDWQYGLSWYLHEELPDLQFPVAHTANTPQFVFVDRRQMPALLREFPGLAVISGRSERAILVRIPR